MSAPLFSARDFCGLVAGAAAQKISNQNPTRREQLDRALRITARRNARRDEAPLSRRRRASKCGSPGGSPYRSQATEMPGGRRSSKILQITSAHSQDLVANVES